MYDMLRNIESLAEGYLQEVDVASDGRPGTALRDTRGVGETMP